MLHDCLKVRRGIWDEQSAVSNLWDLGDSLEPIQRMCAEVSTYSRLKALQVCVNLANALLLLMCQHFVVQIIVCPMIHALRWCFDSKHYPFDRVQDLQKFVQIAFELCM